MPKSAPFEAHAERYDEWFEAHPTLYASELALLREMLPPGAALEVGVGSGRFAAPLGVAFGVEPAPRMREIARRRGIDAVEGVAEALPYADASFDVVLMVTTICFVDDLDASLREARRVLRRGGHIVIGFIDRESPVGREYERRRAGDDFYSDATFYAAAEVEDHLLRAGFRDLVFRQTLFDAGDDADAPERSADGHGRGSFVVVRARTPVPR